MYTRITIDEKFLLLGSKLAKLERILQYLHKKLDRCKDSKTAFSTQKRLDALYTIWDECLGNFGDNLKYNIY
jgi:hypothetical protein